MKQRIISPNALLWKCYGNAQFRYSFGQIAETFRKLCVSTKSVKRKDSYQRTSLVQ